MESLINNSRIVYDAIRNNVKVSFINMLLKSKYYNKQMNYSALIQAGCVRSKSKNTSFIPTEVDAIIKDVESSLGSYELTKHEVRTLTDKKSKKTFEVLDLYISPIDIG
jgi:hypothetical protein